ncbi:cytochrome P450 [Schizophyllum commune H4-8]|nr:cytochrome P450 [Schizophyllum commune H4-8]KAI5893942.1 cytochrome P450 [Schizophyllum commune H4-8]
MSFCASASYVSIAALVYSVTVCVHRLHFHPLARVPGPLLGALTDYYVTYYDIVKDGATVDQLQKLHAIYGPVVRIGPNALHFSNPDVYHQIYTRGTSFLKDPALYRAFPDKSSFGSIDPVQAKARRDAISPLFSRRAIAKLEPFIQEKIDKLTNRLLNYHDVSKPVDLLQALRAATLDIIYSYCFGEDCYALDAPDFKHPILMGADSVNRATLIFKAFPALIYVHRFLIWLLQLLGCPAFGPGLLVNKISTQLDGLLADSKALADAPHETIFHHILPGASANKKSTAFATRRSLLDEALSLQIAGSHTVAAACYVGCFHVLNNRSVHQRLTVDLKDAIPDVTDAVRLEMVEKLPYLTAVIKEALRLSHGIVSPMLRTVNSDGVVLDGIAVPRGTTVAVGNTFVHLNPEIFPNPHTFDPERWLKEDAAALEHYLVAFSKGQRSCTGINLAWCELYLILATLFRRLDLELVNSSPASMEYSAHLVAVFHGEPIQAVVRPMSS